MTTELVVRFEGGVVESNLDEYEKDVQLWIDNINTKLDTEEEFAQAKKDIGKAQEIENKLHDVRQAALAQLGDAFTILTRIDQWAEKVRQDVRLNLNRQVDKERARQRTEAVDNGLAAAKKVVTGSPVDHLFDVSRAEFEKCIKGKRDINKAIEEYLEKLKTDVSALTKKYNHNIQLINDAEEYSPGLFPDIRTLAGNDTETVEATIESRIAKHKLALVEKEKAEAARKAEEEKRDAEKKTETEQQEQKPQVTGTFAEEPQASEQKQYVITMPLSCGRDDAIALAKDVDSKYRNDARVSEINLSAT